MSGLKLLREFLRAAQDGRMDRRIRSGGRFARKVFRSIGRAGYLIVVDMGDYRLALRANDDAFVRHAAMGGDFQRQTFDRALALIAEHRRLPGDVFLDIGANVGSHTIFAARSGKFHRIVSFEPDPRNVEIAKMNVSLNDLTDMVDVIPIACGDTNALMPLSINKNSSTISSLVRTSIASYEVTVRVRPLDDVLSELAISPAAVAMVYIDVEGFEPAVVRGAKSIIEASVPMVVEFNPQWYSNGDRQSLVDILSKYKNVYDISGEHPKPASLDEVGRQTDILVF